MANKKATIYILNVNESMGDSFTTARDTAIDYLEDKLLAARKTDLASVLLVGTEETNNILAEQTPEQYQNISTLSPLAMPKLELLRTLKQTSVSQTQADVLDAVIIANQMIVDLCKKLKYTKSIVVFTDNTHSIDWLDLEAVADMLIDADIKLTVIASDYESYDSQDSESTIKTNMDNWKELAEKTRDGSLMSLKEAYELTLLDFVKEVRPTPTYRGYLYLGNPHEPNESHHYIAMHISMYLRTKEVKFPSGVRWSVLSEKGSHEVEKESKYMIEQADQNEQLAVVEGEAVERESLVKAYRFGKSIVKLTEEEIAYRKLKTHKEMSIIGFIPKDKFPRHYLLSNAFIITAGTYSTEESAIGLKALAHALLEKNSLALVRYVFRDDSQPKIGILQPEFILGEEDRPDTLLLQFFAIAFAEDVRDYKFKSLKDNIKHDPKGQEMMDNLVDAMNLDRGVGKDYLMPEENYNPFTWRMNKSIKDRALNPNASMPELKASFKPQLDIAPVLKEKVGEIGAEIASYYKVKQIISKKKESRKSVFVEDITSDPSRNMDDVLGDVVQGSDNDTDMPLAPRDIDFGTQDEVIEISEDTPVKDFHALLAKPSRDDTVEYATKEMERVIMLLLEKNFETNAFKKVIDCLKALRELGVKEDAAAIYNHTVRQVKAWCKPTHHDHSNYQLWLDLKKNKLGLITNEECEDTDIANTTKEVAEQFWNENELDVSADKEQGQEKHAFNDNEFDPNELDDMF